MGDIATRLPLAGPWSIAPGDVVLVVVSAGPAQEERYARVRRVRRGVQSRRIVGITTADGRRYRVVEGARLCWHWPDGTEHTGAVGVVAKEVSDG